MTKIVATSPSFSKNIKLQKEIYKYFSDVTLNLEGTKFNENQLIDYIKNADAIIIGLDNINATILDKCPNLKFIAKYGVGLDNIDLDTCKARNIQIGWTGGTNKLSVAEMALGLMLMLARNIFISSNELKNGRWNKSAGFQLSEKKIGIIGLGYVGKELVRLLKPFECKIFANDLILEDKYCKENQVTPVSKEEIFRISDFITINAPYNETTNNLINLDVFKIMKNSAYLINVARGGIINEEDLKFALKNNIIAGAALDAYSEEPAKDLELLRLPNLICTPHIGGNSQEAIEKMGLSAINHLRDFFKL